LHKKDLLIDVKSLFCFFNAPKGPILLKLIVHSTLFKKKQISKMLSYFLKKRPSIIANKKSPPKRKTIFYFKNSISFKLKKFELK